MSSITFSLRKYALLFAKNHIMHMWEELLPLKLRSSADLLRILFAVCPLANGSNAELQLLKPEHLGRNICRELYGSLVGGVGGSDIAFGSVAAAVDGVACDIHLSKRNVEMAKKIGVCCYR